MKNLHHILLLTLITISTIPLQAQRQFVIYRDGKVESIKRWSEREDAIKAYPVREKTSYNVKKKNIQALIGYGPNLNDFALYAKDFDGTSKFYAQQLNGSLRVYYRNAAQITAGVDLAKETSMTDFDPWVSNQLGNSGALYLVTADQTLRIRSKKDLIPVVENDSQTMKALQPMGDYEWSRIIHTALAGHNLRNTDFNAYTEQGKVMFFRNSEAGADPVEVIVNGERLTQLASGEFFEGKAPEVFKVQVGESGTVSLGNCLSYYTTYFEVKLDQATNHWVVIKVSDANGEIAKKALKQVE